MSSLNVMVVDDSEITVRKITKILEDIGHKVIASCPSGKEVEQTYRRVNPDIVTMDITMPDIDGIEATRILVRQFPDVKIVMVTSHGQEQMVMEAISAGALGYVLKPIKPEKLKNTIEKVVASQRGLPNDG